MRYRSDWTDAVVQRSEEVAEDVLELTLLPPGGTEPYTPGAHIDVSVLVKESPEVRSYSLVGTYSRGEPYRIAVKKLPNSRGGSAYMWRLRPGNRLRISRPANHFELGNAPGCYLLVAGGIGITPLVSMAQALSGSGESEARMVYVGRREEGMPYTGKLQSLLGDRLTLHFSEREGRIRMDRIFRYADAKTRMYICGPMGLINAVRREWENRGFQTARLRFETFGASGLFAPQSFRVKLPRLGQELEVGGNESLLQALERAGIEVLSDCRKGECGLCLVDVLDYSGDIDHRDYFLSEGQKAENRKLCACVSRVANGAIAIDTSYRPSEGDKVTGKRQHGT